MSQWRNDELSKIGSANELHISTTRRDGTLRSPVPIWVVRVGDDLYIRAYRGRGGSWFRQATRNPVGHIRAGGVERTVAFEEADAGLRDSIDAAYRQKYGRGQYVDAMVTTDAGDAAFKLTPVD